MAKFRKSRPTPSANGEEPLNTTTASTDKAQTEKTIRPPVSNYWRILSYGTRLEHGGLLLGICCAAASGVPLPLMNIVFGSLVGDFNNYFIPGGGVTERQFKHSVAQSSLYIVYLFVGKFVLTYVSMFSFRTMGLRVSAALRLAYMRSLFSQPVAKLDEVSSGTVANTITSSSNTIQLSISNRLHNLFQSLAVLIAAYAIAFRYSWALTLATSSGVLFVIIVYSITTPFFLKAQQRIDQADAKHVTVAGEVISSIRTVFALGAESKLSAKHARWVTESHKQNMKLAPLIGVQLAPMFFAIYACYALSFWFGLQLYQDGHIHSVSTVIVVFFSVLIVTSIMGNIVQPLMDITKAISASSGFFDMIDSPHIDRAGLREPEVTAHGDIVLKDINFAYPTRLGVQVLRNFDATFRNGKTTALVGPSGSGKSTIVALLERWYELQHSSKNDNNETANHSPKTNHDGEAAAEKQQTPRLSSGTIELNGHNINNFDLKWWRSRVGLVQQEPFLFNDTIEHNVAFGLVGTEWEYAKSPKKLELVEEACREAFADEFIRNLPKGYQSVVGEAGIKLSGGQRQRIAIARSIIRKPAILILDEATSSIDVQGERIVQEALDRLSQNRTTIMIAHRLSTIRKADHIIVLRNGVKVEEGTHDQLLALANGLYSSLTNAQKLEEQDTTPALMEEAKDEKMRTELSHESKTIERLQSRGSSDAADPEKGSNDVAYRKRGFFSTVGLLLYEQRAQWLFYVLVVLSAMACGAAYAIQSWLFAKLVVAFTLVGQALKHAQNFWSLMFFVLALSVGACYGILGWSSAVVSAHVATVCREDYFGSTLKMPIPYFDQEENSSSTIMSRLSSDPKQLQELLGLTSALPLISVFNVIGSVIVSFYFGWKLTLVTLFAVLPIVLGAAFVRVRFEYTFEKLDAKVFAGSSQFATEVIGAFRTVTSLAMEDSIVGKYQGLLEEQIQKSTRKASYAMLIYALSDSVELCGMALTFWYGGQLLASREYQPLQFFVIFAAIVQGAQAAGTYLSISPNIAHSTSAANRMLELRSKVADQKLSTVQPAVASQAGFGAKVEFKDVHFTYPTQSVPLFSRLDLVIEPGQFVAFVGPSGCGKTTTVSLLERFYSPASGTITIDGNDIGSIDPQVYRRDLALVSQEPRLFSGTVRQNLLLGVEESAITEGQITQACQDAEIHDFITSLPDGYNTELGLNTQTALSGGQKQRMCLARALLRKPKLLLLDEATSSLDSQSERLVQEAIERLAGQRSMTVIAVAHRLATIQKADVIFVFGERDVNQRKGTKIVEMGTHRELLRERGVYYAMCQVQTLDR